MSERHACRLVGLSRDSYRNAPVASAQTEALKTKIVEIAHARRRFGYRRVHDLLRLDFPGVNHNRVYRLYSDANLAVRKRKKVRRPPAERTPLNIATKVNEVWSMDFVSDSLANGRRLKCLSRVAEFSPPVVVQISPPGWDELSSCGRTRPALSLSFKRYELPRMFIVTAWWSNRSRMAVAITRSPKTSPQAPKL